MLLKRGERFAELSEQSRSTIARLAYPFVRHNSTVLTHGKSRVVSAVRSSLASSSPRARITRRVHLGDRSCWRLPGEGINFQ
jgi:translation initiation factor 2B subunit (eIF-2B alpha/beta/delta family)